MELKLQYGDSITIPDDCKAIIKDGKVVFEKEQRFKNGDILAFTSDCPCPFIYTCTDKRGYHKFYAGVNRAGELILLENSDHSWGNGSLRYATDGEKQLLFDKMKEQGLRWNAEENQIEEIRWRAKEGDEYFLVGLYGDCVVYDEDGVSVDEKLYKFGNYFRTKEQVKEASKRVEEVLIEYHQEIGE